MADVFVSYASEDRDRVAPLVDALERHGWSVWWDRHVAVGHRFDRDIEVALDAARCIVVVWSRHSIDSDWVRAEATEGLERGLLVPIALDDARPPLAFRRLQTLTLAGTRPADLGAFVAAVEAFAPIGVRPDLPTNLSNPPPPVIRSRPRVLLLGWEIDEDDRKLVSFARKLREDIWALSAAYPPIEAVSAETTQMQIGRGPLGIARSLDTDYVVFGRIEQLGDQREISVRITNVSTEKQTNATAMAPTRLSFEEQRSLTVEILSRVWSDIQIDLAEHLDGLPPESLDRWGLLATRRSSPERLAQLKRAVALYPDFALARAILAQVGAMGITVGWPRSLVDIAMVKENVDQALRLAPSDAHVLSACGYASALIGESDLGLTLVQEAELRFHPARLNLVFPLTRLGRAAEAIAIFDERSRWGLPFTPIGWAAVTEACIVAGRFEQAVEFARHGVLRTGMLEVPMWGHLANALGHLGRRDEAHEAWRRAKELAPQLSVKSWTRGWSMQFKDPKICAPLIEGLVQAGLE